MKIKLNQIAQIYFGINSKPRKGSDLIYLQPRNFNSNGTLREDEPLLTIPRSEDTEKNILGNELVLFAAKGNRNYAFTFDRWWAPAVASSSFFVIACDTGKILPNFLSFYLNLDSSKRYFKGKAAGTNVPSIKKNDLEDLPVFLPPKDEQEKILNLYDLLKKEKDLLHLLSEKKNIIYQSLFNKIIKEEI